MRIRLPLLCLLVGAAILFWMAVRPAPHVTDTPISEPQTVAQEERQLDEKKDHLSKQEERSVLAEFKPSARIGFTNPSFALGHSVEEPETLFDREKQQEFLNSQGWNVRLRAVHLKSRAFVPGIVGAVEPGEFYLSFESSPNAQQREALGQAGIQLLEHVTRKTWRAFIAQPLETSTLSGLTGIEPVWGIDKWSSGVWKSYFNHPQSERDVVVSLIDGADVDEAETLFSRLDIDAELLRSRSPIQMALNGGMDQLLALSGSPLVSGISLPEPAIRANNANAAALSKVDDLLSPSYGLTGTNINVVVRDGGEVASHPDFGNRVTIVDNVSVSAHATHVAGTIAGSGAGSSSAKGMAPEARLYSYDYSGWADDELEDAFATYNARISNHSYGHVIGWDDGEWTDNTDWFGEYSVYAQYIDDLIYGGDYYVFKSAGNDRNDSGTPTGSEPDHDGTLYEDGKYYDCMEDVACAKNIITVGAVDDDKTMSDFSNFGPTDDGRIKPDIVANGVGLYSTVSATSYASYNGTSMSSPAACGAATLLLEQYRLLNDNAWPSSAFLKGLIIHTAEDLGRTGPDYSFGWGLLDAKKAADLLRTNNSSFTRFMEESVSEGATNHYALLLSDSADKLRITLCWTDQKGSTSAADALVNDLDVKLTSPDGNTTYYPYVLPFAVDGSSPVQQATTGTNIWDNVEQIEVNNATSGTWDIEVSGSVVPAGSQDYALFVSEGNLGTPILDLSDTNLTFSAPAGLEDTASLVISNSGDAELFFSLSDASAATNYTWVDSDDANGPEYSWIDISSLGSSVSLADDGKSTLRSVGFDFPFYDGVYNQFQIGANGGISFSVDSLIYANSELPSADAPSQSLLAFWDDLSPNIGGTVRYHGTSERLVVSWLGVPFYGGSNPQTFQIVLYPDGRIVYQYKTLNGTLSGCTVGLQDNQTNGPAVQVAYNESYLKNNLAIEFSPPVTWLTHNGGSRAVPPGASTSVVFTASAEDLEMGVYTTTVVLACNDIDSPVVNLPVRFSVSAPDQDADGLPDEWETQYFGSSTAAEPSLNSDGDEYSNEEEYIAGLNPTNADQFVIQSLDAGGVLGWSAVSGRVYNVYWTSNLLSPFTLLQSNYTGGAFTDQTHSADQEGFYRIEAQLAP